MRLCLYGFYHPHKYGHCTYVFVKCVLQLPDHVFYQCHGGLSDLFYHEFLGDIQCQKSNRGFSVRSADPDCVISGIGPVDIFLPAFSEHCVYARYDLSGKIYDAGMWGTAVNTVRLGDCPDVSE